MGRTVRPMHKDLSAAERAQKLVPSVRRMGRVSKDELKEAYSRVINTEDATEKQVDAAVEKAFKTIPKLDPQIELDKGELQFYLVRPRS